MKSDSKSFTLPSAILTLPPSDKTGAHAITLAVLAIRSLAKSPVSGQASLLSKWEIVSVSVPLGIHATNVTTVRKVIPTFATKESSCTENTLEDTQLTCKLTKIGSSTSLKVWTFPKCLLFSVLESPHTLQSRGTKKSGAHVQSLVLEVSATWLFNMLMLWVFYLFSQRYVSYSFYNKDQELRLIEENWCFSCPKFN
jgi:hypothetical protein